MTWFKMDDHAWSHPKFIGLSSTAFGVWARIGDWCADHATDGLMSRAVVHQIAPESTKVVDQAIRELIQAKLWIPRPDGMLEFHDWVDHQPTRADIEANRAAGRERQRVARERRRSAAEGATVTAIRAGGAP
jgi:transposase